MNIHDYFENVQGTGVLATADHEGRVNAALYARPHVMEDGTLAFIMADRLSRKNIDQNPHAAYLFQQDGPRREGVRLTLTKVGESSDPGLIEQLRRRNRPSHDDADIVATLRVVYFSVDGQRPLVGEAREATG